MRMTPIDDASMFTTLRRTALAATGALTILSAAAIPVPVAAQAPGGQGAAPAVAVAAIRSENVAPSAQFIGRIQAIQSVDLTARVEGFLDAVSFTEGSFVKQGDVLYEIQQSQYQADLAAANAQKAQAEAQLAAAQAQLKNADLDLARQQELLARQTVAQSVVDQSQAARDEAAAGVQQAQAAIAQAEAQIQQADLNLSYTRITAPIDGRIGATNVTAGNLVSPQSGTLATVVQLDPIRMVFSVPEANWIQFAQQHGINATDAEGTAFVPRLRLPTGDDYEAAGTISFVDNQVDPATATIAIYADFPNPDGALLPGTFVTAIVQAATQQMLPIVPASAIQQDRQGRYVFVVDTDDRAQERRIETSIQTPDGWAVTSGLQAGETVIVQGAQRVQSGMTVSPTPEAASSTASGATGGDTSTGTTTGTSTTGSAGSGSAGSADAAAPASGN